MVITEEMLTHRDMILVRTCVVKELGSWTKAAVWSRIEYRARPEFSGAVKRDGRHWWRATIDEIAAEVEVSPTQLRRVLKELDEGGHIERVRHRVGGFADQTMSYRPLVAETSNVDALGFDSGTTIMDVSYDASIMDGCSSSLKEVKNVETETKPKPVSDQEFEDWYKTYPRKDAKGQARTAFKSARKKTDLPSLDRGRDLYIARLKADGTERKYIKLPSTWLNGECWDDDYGDVTLPGFDAWWAKVTEVGDVGEVSRLVGLTWQVPDVPDGVVPREFLSASRASWLSEVEASVRSRWVTQFGDLRTGP